MLPLAEPGRTEAEGQASWLLQVGDSLASPHKRDPDVLGKPSRGESAENALKRRWRLRERRSMRVGLFRMALRG
eukprot:2129970-Pyramimonas_sp.AAC.1